MKNAEIYQMLQNLIAQMQRGMAYDKALKTLKHIKSQLTEEAPAPKKKAKK